MASALVKTCDICINDFNEKDRHSVELPCGHNFCLTCLANLQAKGDENCPNCRKNWSALNLHQIPAVVDVKIVLEKDQDEDDDLPNKEQKQDHRCEKHKLPFDFWVKEMKAYFCKRCAAENRNVCFVPIEDVIPEIKRNFDLEVSKANKKIEHDLDSLEKKRSPLIKMRDNVKEFAQLINSFDDEIGKHVQVIDLAKSDALKAKSLTKKVQRKMENIDSGSDVNTLFESHRILEQVMNAHYMTERRDTPASETLLGKIVCSFMNEFKQQGTADNLDITSSMNILCDESIDIVKPMHGSANSCDQITNSQEDALLTLTAKSSELKLLVQNDELVNSSAKYCTEIKAIFLDSFLKPRDTQICWKRLKTLTANKGFCLTKFYGHLDGAGVEDLPRTLRGIGLAISDSADSNAVSSLRPWLELEQLSKCGIIDQLEDFNTILSSSKSLECVAVSVGSRISELELRPLPNITRKDIYFPFVTDELVYNVRPILEALVPNKSISRLAFPDSQLTTDGVNHLKKKLHGIDITLDVIIELRGSWKPTEKEQDVIKTQFLNDLDLEVFWSIEWDQI